MGFTFFIIFFCVFSSEILVTTLYLIKVNEWKSNYINFVWKYPREKYLFQLKYRIKERKETLNEIQFELYNVKLGWLVKKKERKQFLIWERKINTEISALNGMNTGHERLKIRGKSTKNNELFILPIIWCFAKSFEEGRNISNTNCTK